MNTCQKKSKRSQSSKKSLKMKYKARKNLKMLKNRRRSNTVTTLKTNWLSLRLKNSKKFTWNR